MSCLLLFSKVSLVLFCDRFFFFFTAVIRIKDQCSSEGPFCGLKALQPNASFTSANSQAWRGPHLLKRRYILIFFTCTEKLFCVYMLITRQKICAVTNTRNTRKILESSWINLSFFFFFPLILSPPYHLLFYCFVVIPLPT